MKKLYIILLFITFFINIVNAQNTIGSPNNQAEEYYIACKNNLIKAETENVITGNEDDVKQEQNIRQCLKTKIIETASLFLPNNELKNYQNYLISVEETLFNMYKTLIFCKDGINDYWCKERYLDDKSLDKLLLEKNLTSHIFKILVNTIEQSQNQ
jgi:hypothetical protein